MSEEGGTKLQKLVAAAGDFVAGDEVVELKSLRVVVIGDLFALGVVFSAAVIIVQRFRDRM